MNSKHGGNMDKNDKNKVREIFQSLLDKSEIDASKSKQKIFISFTDGRQRAMTVFGIGNTLQTAFKQATDRALKVIDTVGYNYIQLHIVSNEIKTTVKDYYRMLGKERRGHLRYNIAFDDMFNTAFLEQEIYANSLIKYIDNITYTFNQEHIDKYLRLQARPKIAAKRPTDPLILFQTTSVFYDRGKYLDLDDDTFSLSKGLRKETYSDELAYDLIVKTADYLYSTLDDQGKTAYGCYPMFHGPIPQYNIIRHTLAAFAFADTYLLTKNEKYKLAGINAVDFMIDNYLLHMDNATTFIIDEVSDTESEIKLGALGVGILAIIKIMETLTDKEKNEKDYITLLRKLGNGILYMQNQQTGNYTHVLHYPSLEVKEEFRIVYYAGEAVFALSALYTIDKDEKWINSINSAMAFFIENDYHKYYDHWLAYAVNEVSKHTINEAYLAFGLKNAFYELRFIKERDTAWHTFLEMLNASYLFIEKIEENNLTHLLEEYDLDYFYETMDSRFLTQRNSIMYPEFAMFFKQPDNIMWGIHIRHHYFRIRNDDIAHHLMGLCNYFRFKSKNEVKK